MARSMLKFIGAVLSAMTATVANSAADESQDVAVSIVNNTTTPKGGISRPVGWMTVSCGSGDELVRRDEPREITCSVAQNETLTVSYVNNEGRGSVHVDCGVPTGPGFNDDSRVTLTFAGSGATVTIAESCANIDLPWFIDDED